MRTFIYKCLYGLIAGCCLLLTACGTEVNDVQPQQTIVVDAGFQTQISPVPTARPYRCGAWTANNIPPAYSTLLIYAKLTKDTKGVPGVKASATVHFRNGDATLAEQPVSDTNGYVTFNLPLQGRQPRMEPATIDITFSGNSAKANCSTFFTPQ